MNDLQWLIRHHIATAPAAPFDTSGVTPAKVKSASKAAAKRAVELLASRTDGVSRPRALVAAVQGVALELASEAENQAGPISLALKSQSNVLADFSLSLLAPGAPRRQANRTIRELMEPYLASPAVADIHDEQQIARIKLRLDDSELLTAARAGWFESKTPATRLKRALVHFLPVAA